MKCDVDIRNALYANVVFSAVTTIFQGIVEHIAEGVDGVVSIHDEVHGGCSIRVKVLGKNWMIHPVFPQSIPASFVFLSCFVGEVHSRRQRVCCSAFASRHCVSTLHPDTLRSECLHALATKKKEVVATGQAHTLAAVSQAEWLIHP